MSAFVSLMTEYGIIENSGDKNWEAAKITLVMMKPSTRIIMPSSALCIIAPIAMTISYPPNQAILAFCVFFSGVVGYCF